MATARAIADRLIPGETISSEVLRLAAANVLMVLCAQVSIPHPWSPVPFTLQTFGVTLIAVLLGGRRSALVMAAYLAEGAMGLPVFNPYGLPGASRLLGPTAGYLWAYPAAAFLTGWISERVNWRDISAKLRGSLQLATAVLAGHALILLSGGAWIAHVLAQGWGSGFAAGIAPFLVDALLKAAMVVAVGGAFARLRPNRTDAAPSA